MTFLNSMRIAYKHAVQPDYLHWIFICSTFVLHFISLDLVCCYWKKIIFVGNIKSNQEIPNQVCSCKS